MGMPASSAVAQGHQSRDGLGYGLLGTWRAQQRPLQPSSNASFAMGKAASTSESGT